VDALHECLEREIWNNLSDKATLRMGDGTLVDTYSYRASLHSLREGIAPDPPASRS
jgi:hypothetical protein